MSQTDRVIHLEETIQLPTYKKYPIALVRGAGPYVWDAEGTRYLDFYGGHCVTPLGHCPPRVTAAIQEQAETLLFYSNVVYSPVRAEAAALLSQLAPDGVQRVYLCSSGAEANETALKLARTTTGRSHIVAMEGAFHGRTLGVLATTHNPKYRAPYLDVLADVTWVPFGDAEAAARVLRQRGDVAGVIVEPIQSVAGCTTAPPDYFRALRNACDEAGTTLIFDEVQTGVGRTGAFSISEHFGMTPDFITLAKSLGSGVPVGAVLTTDAIADTVNYGDQGTTFGGGMLAMRAMQATLETIRDEALMLRATHLFDRLEAICAPHAKEVRGRGCLIGVELHTEATPIVEALRASGILVGTSGHPRTMRLMPPLNTPDEAVDAFGDAFAAVAA